MKTTPVICQLLHGLRVGGAEVLAARLARRLSGRYRFRFVCLDELGSLGEELRREGFPVTVLGRRPGLDWRLPVRLARVLSGERVDLVHAHQYTPFFYALAARVLSWRSSVLFTEHGRWLPDYPRRKRIVFNRLLLRKRDRVVGVGEVIRRALIDNEGIPAGRVEVVYNGVDLSPYGDPHIDRTAARSDMGVSASDFVVIQVARLVPIKDHPTALKAVQGFAPSLPNLRFVIVGEGPEEAAIRAFVERHDLSGVVRLLGLRTDVARLLLASDVFLLSSQNEGIPLTVIEAMAAGLPVVSTAAGGVGEVVLDGRTGLLAPVGDPATLARHLDALAFDTVRRREMGERGRERAFAQFDEEQMLGSYDRIYQEMLRG